MRLHAALAHAWLTSVFCMRSSPTAADYVVRPLYVKLADVEPTLGDCLTRVDANRAMWSDIISASGGAAAAVGVTSR
jgi:hypothetical protein